MEEQQLTKLQNLLLQEQEQLEQRLNHNENYGLDRSMNQSVGEISGYDNHPADMGTEMFERGKDIALNELDEKHLADILSALDRIAQGTYGKCRQCNEEIPFERLEAIPTTEYCISHCPKQSIRDRPVEEEVIHPGISFSDRRGETEFDGEDAWQEVERYGTSNPPDYFEEGSSYQELVVEAGENRGYVDVVEGFSIVDLDGNSSDITQIAYNKAYSKKEGEVNEEEWN